MDVGSVDVGAVSTAALVSITNTGLVGGAITVTAAPAGLVAATGCAGSLAAGASCVLQITGTPTAVGRFQGSVTVAAQGGNTVIIVVQGTGTQQGNFTISPTTIDLGSLAMGEVVQTAVTVTAQANLTGLATSVRGTDVRIEPTSTCGATLTAGQSCTVAVRFTAGASGASTGNAVVIAQGGVTKTVPITATVLTPAKLAATPATAGLTARVGETSPPLTINIGNIGGMPTGQLAVAIAPASFKVVSETCSIVTLAAGATCSVVVAYSPAATATADEVGTLTVTDKGVGASVATVALTGSPTRGALTLTGGPDLGSVAPGNIGQEVLFTVTNTGPTPSGPLTAAVSSAAITISSNTCATKATLATSETCTIGLRLTPAAGAAPATVAALLTVTGANASISLTVTGAIVTPGKLLANPTSVNFGSVFVNQLSAIKTVTLTNGGATATGVLSVNLTGPGAAQVALAGNTCTAALAPAQSCTISVQYGPTDTTGVNGTITVTDGSASAAISMVGTGLAPTNFLACKQMVLDNQLAAPAYDVCSLMFGEAIASELDMGEQTVGYTTANPTGSTSYAPYTIRVVVAAEATSDSGAITAALSGPNAADYKIVNNKCTAALNPGGNCTMDITFTPAAAGASTATLTITGAKGGVWTVALKGMGLALVEIMGAGCADEAGVPFADQDPNSPEYSLSFGQQPLSTQGAVCKYTLHVRGATSPAATTTTTDLALATSTPPDFRNVLITNFGTLTQTITPTETNPCDNKAVTLVANVGAAYTCDFFIQFFPQTSKSTANGDKTATVTATASAGGSDSIKISGTATGPLTIGPDPAEFADVFLGAASATNTTLATTLTVGGLTGEVKTLTVRNEGVVAQGILGVALGGTNAGDFGIIEDLCTGETLDPMAGAAVDSCTIKVIFAPIAAGAKTATVTVKASTGGETAVAQLTGSASNPYAVTVAPLTADFSPAPGLVPVPQGKGSAWATFTISNPAAAPRTGKLSYGFGSCASLSTAESNFELFTVTSGGAYAAGSCGDSNTAQLDPGTNCTVQARFKPTNTAAPSSLPRTAVMTVCVGGAPIADIDLSGLAGPQLTVTGTAVSVVDNMLTADFGNVAVGTLTSTTITVTNNSLAAAALTSVLAGGVSITGGTCPASGGTLAGAESCTVILSVTIPVGQPAIDETITFSDAGTAATTVSLNVLATPVPNAALQLFGMNPAAVGTSLSPIEFGEVPILSAAANGSGVVTLWFINAGGLPAKSVTGAVVNSDTTDPTAFSIVAESKGTCFSLPSNQLDPMKTCSVRLQFKPTNTTGGTPAGRKIAQFTLTGETVTSNAVFVAGTAVGNPPEVPYANVVGGTSSVYAFPSTAIAAATGATVFFEIHNPTTAGVTVAQPTNGDFVVDATATAGGTACPSLVAGPATTCQVRVTFIPSKGGSGSDWAENTKFRVGSLVAGSYTLAGLIGQAQQPAKLRLTATGTTAAKVVTGISGSGTVDFGQIMEAATPSVTFTITNIGEGTTAGVPAAEITGGLPSVYLDAGDCGTVRLAGTAGGTCAAGAVCSCTATVSVLGNLSRGGYTAATVQAVDQTAAAWESSAESFVVGVKVVSPALLKLTPATFDFSPTGTLGTYVGSTGGVATFTIRNGDVGDTSNNRQDAKGVKVQLNDNVNFKLENVNCPLGLDGTFVLSTDTVESCTYTVTFKPEKVGALNATLSVTSTVGGAPTATVKGRGVGSLTVSPASTADADQRTTVSSAGRVLTFTNNGGERTNMLRTTLSNTTKFAVVVDSCFGQALEAGQSCTVTVEFTGTATEAATPINAEVTVSDGSTTSTNNTATAYLKSAVPTT